VVASYRINKYEMHCSVRARVMVFNATFNNISVISQMHCKGKKKLSQHNKSGGY
jgi:hypothetical protein